jgi:hypothetical protein
MYSPNLLAVDLSLPRLLVLDILPIKQLYFGEPPF